MPRGFSLPVAIALFFSILSFTGLWGQHPAWHNFTTTEGLPSNEIYSVLQDRQGFVWLATAQGICRFDGYEFRRPVDTSVQAGGSVFKLAQDSQGRIWFNHLNSTLSIIEHDTVRPWPYNAILQEYKDRFGSSGSFAIEKDGSVWLTLLNLGFLVVRPDGSHRLVPDTDKNFFVFTEIENKSIYTNQLKQPLEEMFFEGQRGLSLPLLQWKDGQMASLGRLPVEPATKSKGKWFGVIRLNEEDLLVCYLQRFYLFRQGRMVWHGMKDMVVHHMFYDNDGSILLSSNGGKNQGLLRYRSLAHFQRDEFDNLLPGHAVVSMNSDREGAWWVATSDAGVFYCQNHEIEVYDMPLYASANPGSGLPANFITSLTTDGRDMVYAGLNPFDICTINRFTGRISTLPRPTYPGHAEVPVVRFDTLTGRLWCGIILSYFENGHWTPIRQNIPGVKEFRPAVAKKISAHPSGSPWWSSSAYGFYFIDPQRNAASKVPAGNLTNERTYSVTPDRSGNLWVTMNQGLRIWRDSAYLEPPFTHPALRFPARNMEFLPDGGMVISLRGGGLLIRDPEGAFTRLTHEDGLTSDWLTDLDISPQGAIYACSNAGLNKINKEGGKWHIETITVKNGLPSNQVNDILLLDDELWLATDRGIVRFHKKTAPSSIPAPLLDQLRVNNAVTHLRENLCLAYDQNNIALRFLSIYYRSNGDITYRYRLLGADTNFVYSRAREANFIALRPGAYTFEVQAQNEDGAWSETTRWTFEINPAWWNTIWFYLFIGAIVLSAGWLFYRTRLRAARHEAKMQAEIRELQMAALRAQMNPHFIFNCLSSIQNFIVENDTAAASRYLARFARLVRLALHGSLDGRHALADEVELLENYLALEQLRFRGRFDFSVEVEEGIDPEEVNLPPMLVQPFVENAIVHGMKGKAEGGRISVVFSQNPAGLVVTVRDNGSGIGTGKNDSTGGGHKSVGMRLTQNRLGLLLGVGKRSDGKPRSGTAEAPFTQEQLRSEDGTVLGTEVRIEIPLA